jgi:protein O-mannosyl-transferase
MNHMDHQAKDERTSAPPQAVALSARSAFGPKDWLFALALVLAVFLVYQPAWHGGMIWDDDAHLTCPALRSVHGLWRIWFELGASSQYYPLLHSAFWIEHRLWGDSMLGYHLMNLALHATAALLVALILRRLAVPGAYLAAAIFALHPVCVESVAWITEQKNTLSAVFYLGAMLSYLHFDQTRLRRHYCLALGLFVAGLLSKTVIATLPGALLVIFWWQRGRLSWKRDVLPLIPFFVLGVAAGLLTAWVERKLVGAEGTEFELTWLARGLLAGRVIWFYVGKLLWPVNLLFMYPRPKIDPTVWWQYLFPAALLLALALLWALRRRWRGPLAGTLFFIGTLFPVLGFLNVYPFRYSFVADHFQYLASLGIITLVSAGIALLLAHWNLWRRPGGYMACMALLSVLASLTWRQSRMYADIETLYRTTVDANPDCWMAQNNLASTLAKSGRSDEALAHWRKALAIRTDLIEPHNNLGKALASRGQFTEAIAHYRKAIEINPDCSSAHCNLGVALASLGRFDEALKHYRRAIQLAPDNIDARNNAGAILLRQGNRDEAIAQFEAVLQIKPNDEVAHFNLGVILSDSGQDAAALTHYRQAVEIKPDYREARCNLGLLLERSGQPDEAMAQFQKALEIDANLVEAHQYLANILANRGQWAEAIAHYQKVVEARPNDAGLRNNLGAALERGGKPEEAIAQFRKALEIKPNDPAVQYNLGLALAAGGKAAEAVACYRKALELKPDYAEPHCSLGMTLYQQGQWSEAIGQLREALRLMPKHVVALNQLAWALATCPEASLRNGAEAVRLAQQAVQWTDAREPVILDTLAAAYAEAGQFPKAVETIQRALTLASARGDAATVDTLRARQKLYQAGTPYHEHPDRPPP